MKLRKKREKLGGEVKSKGLKAELKGFAKRIPKIRKIKLQRIKVRLEPGTDNYEFRRLYKPEEASDEGVLGWN